MNDFERIEQMIDQEQFDEAALQLERLEERIHDVQFHLLLRHVAKNLGMKSTSPLDSVE